MRRALIRSPAARKPSGMTPVFDIDDRARLPWRFFGARRAARGRL